MDELEISAANRLNKDCWSVILGFIWTKPRFRVSQTNKEIYSSLSNSFTDQDISLHRRLRNPDVEFPRPYNCNSQINDSGLVFLSKAEKINLSDCIHFTDDGLIHLSNVKGLDLTYTRVTDDGLAYLKNVKDINLMGCHNITDDGLAHLKNVKDINLMSCHNITDDGLAHLSNVEKIILTSTDITDIGVALLENVKVINLHHCKRVTEAGREKLKSRGVEII